MSGDVVTRGWRLGGGEAPKTGERDGGRDGGRGKPRPLRGWELGAGESPPPADPYLTQELTVLALALTHAAAALSLDIFLPEMRFATKF